MEKQFYSWEQFEDDCNKLTKLIQTKERSLKNIYGIPRGGLVLAVRLSHKLDLPLITDRSSVTKATLVVDDIADTGDTLNHFSGSVEYTTLTLFYNPKSICKPTYFSREKDKWVVFPWEEEATSRYDNIT